MSWGFIRHVGSNPTQRPTKMLTITTGRLSDRRKWVTSGWAPVDITIKSGRKEFAPTWDMVLKYKSGQMSEQQYEVLYNQMMDRSQVDNFSMWASTVTEFTDLILLCFCPSDRFCHRHLLKYYLRDFAQRLGVECQVVKERKP